MSYCYINALSPWICSPTCGVQFGANDSNRGEIVASFRAALEPMRAVLKEYPFLSGTEEPNYSDIFVFSFFLVRKAILWCMHTTEYQYNATGNPLSELSVQPGECMLCMTLLPLHAPHVGVSPL